MPNHPDRNISGQHPGSDQISHEPNEWKLDKKDLQGKNGNGPKLVPLTRSEAARIPASLITPVPHEGTDRKTILIPHTFSSIARQLRRINLGRREGDESITSTVTRSEGEPISGVIPKDFISAYRASKRKQGHNPRYVQQLTGEMQKIARGLTESKLQEIEVDNMLYTLDVLVLETPTQNDVEKDPTLIEQSRSAVLTYEHSRLALKDPIGYAMYVIRTDAVTQGIHIKIGDEQLSKRLSRFQREHYRKTHLNRRPLA